MLLDKYLPKYTYKEYHEIQISCSKEQAYTAARNLDFSKSKTIKFLLTIRGLPTNDMTLEGFSNQVKFTFLEEIQNEEFIIGFWAKVLVEKILDRDQFAIDNKSRRIKIRPQRGRYWSPPEGDTLPWPPEGARMSCPPIS